MDDAAQIRERIAALGPRRRGARIPEDLRREIGAYARRRRAAGAGVGEIAQETGVSGESVRRWAGTAARGEEISVVPVRVRAAANGGIGVVVQTAAGHRVTGLDLEGAVRVLRMLG
jgi:predicted transcriptional regulator